MRAEALAVARRETAKCDRTRASGRMKSVPTSSRSLARRRLSSHDALHCSGIFTVAPLQRLCGQLVVNGGTNAISEQVRAVRGALLKTAVGLSPPRVRISRPPPLSCALVMRTTVQSTDSASEGIELARLERVAVGHEVLEQVDERPR